MALRIIMGENETATDAASEKRQELQQFIDTLAQTPAPVHYEDSWKDLPPLSRLQNLRAARFSVRDAENLVVIVPVLREREGLDSPPHEYSNVEVPAIAAANDLATLLHDHYGITTAYSINRTADRDMPIRDVLIWKPENAAEKIALYHKIAQAWEEVISPDSLTRGGAPRYPLGLASSMMKAATADVALDAPAPENTPTLRERLNESAGGRLAAQALDRIRQGEGKSSDRQTLLSFHPEADAGLREALAPAIALLKEVPQAVLRQQPAVVPFHTL